MKATAAALCAALLLGSGLALAQGKPMVRVVLEGVGQEASACGIRAAAIESLAVQVLNKHGIQVSADAGHPYLYLNINAYRVMQGSRFVGCTTRLGVSVRASLNANPLVGAIRSKAGAYAVLCDAARLLSGSQRDVAGAVTKAFEEDIASCLGQLSY